MILQGMVFNGEVLESTFYDQVTGQPKPGYSVKLTVLDQDTGERYECQLTDGFASLEELKVQKKQGQPIEVLQQLAEQLRAELPPKMTPVVLHVQKIKGKGSFLTLVCRFAHVA